jgi:hypothetical protein
MKHGNFQKRLQQFLHLRFCPLVGKMNGSQEKEIFCFLLLRGCGREIIFIAFILFASFTKQ